MTKFPSAINPATLDSCLKLENGLAYVFGFLLKKRSVADAGFLIQGSYANKFNSCSLQHQIFAMVGLRPVTVNQQTQLVFIITLNLEKENMF